MTVRQASLTVSAVVFLYICDRTLKWLAIKTLDQGFFVLPGVKLELYYNQGVAFGIVLPHTVMILVSVLILLLLVWWVIRLIHFQAFGKMFFVLLVLVGGFSNLLDRLLFKSVVDYVSIFSLTVFNLADCYIVIGIIVLLYSYWFKQRREKHDITCQSRDGNRTSRPVD